MSQPRNAQVQKLFLFSETEDFACVAERTRHLTKASRSLIAAVYSKRDRGGKGVMPGAVMILDLSAAFNVSDGVIGRAKTVLKYGSAEDIQRIYTGEAGVAEVAIRLRRENRFSTIGKKPPAKRKSSARAARKVKNRNINAEIWLTLRNALFGIASLPRAKDVVDLINGGGKSSTVEDYLPKAIKFLQELNNEHNERTRKIEERKTRKDTADARNGPRAA